MKTLFSGTSEINSKKVTAVDSDGSEHNSLSDFSSDNTHSDPTWGQIILNDKDSDDKSISPNIIETKIQNAGLTPTTQKWKINNINEKEKTELELNLQSPFKSPGKWSIQSVPIDSTKRPTTIPNQTTTESVFKSSHEFQKFVFSSMTHVKYDIGAIMHIVNDTNKNVQALIAHYTNKNDMLTTTNQDLVDMNVFPVQNDEDLKIIENKIQESARYRNELVFKLSLLVDSTSVNTSVRRIIGRLCDDSILLNYSLTGFKHNLSFSSLKIYRVLIDAIKRNIQYASVPDQNINAPLKVWFDHAKFRKEKGKNKNNTS
ncbi:uncharacterized protein LOC126834995 [Adelges cooleyi]|uniref:uncharacterized protein LOC126834995 n=1 Tax=Adelges cooleyi TaxID=133065 RepID=UPI00217F70F9|nr:uncharacterized protein LOC126834995 [Adelges cooleyi]